MELFRLVCCSTVTLFMDARWVGSPCLQPSPPSSCLPAKGKGIERKRKKEKEMSF